MRNIRKKVVMMSILIGLFTLSLSSQAIAHVVVKPNEVKPGAFETFTISVPNERQSATSIIKLEIPAGVEFVTPTVKNGWTIDTEKSGSEEAAITKSITWSGNSIPAGFRDDFTFSAKVPAKTTELHWKAFQTYDDGVVVSWNLSEGQLPKKADGSPDFSVSGPYSITKIADTSTPATDNSAEDKANTALTLAVAAAIISLVSLFLATRSSRTRNKL